MIIMQKPDLWDNKKADGSQLGALNGINK